MNHTREGKKNADISSEFVDAKFESLMHDIERMMSAFRQQMKELNSEERVDRFQDVCRAMRTTKLHFYKVLDRYGADYEDSAQHFVDLAYAAADMAATHTASPDLQASLKRHAEEIESARSESLSETRKSADSAKSPRAKRARSFITAK